MSAWTFIPPDTNGIAFLELDVPDAKVNVLSASVMLELDALLDDALSAKKIKALIVSSRKRGVFIAGADVAEIGTICSETDGHLKSQEGQAVFRKLEKMPYPTVAVIDGACLGGGLELALACTFRVVTDSPKTKLGLPEVNLGILPGWGGTQRLPRLVGLVQALTMILSGRPVNGSKAERIGLADKRVPHEFVAEQAYEFAEQVLTAKGRRAVIRKRKCHRLESLPPMKQFILKKAGEKAERKARGHYPAIPAILNLLKETGRGSLVQGLEKEAAAFSRLVMTPECRNLIGLFHIDQQIKKERGGTAEVRKLERTAVLGAGVMGGGIAWLFSRHGRPVRMKDISWEAVGRGFAEAADYYGQLVKLRKMKAPAVSMAMHRISGTVDYTGFRAADLVVEAVVEKMEVKKGVLSELETKVRDDAVICSNTSALSITEMASVLKHPERFAGMHFFNPVNRMPLVEVIAGGQTSEETVVSVVALAHELQKTPVVVKDSPGFLVNRILIPYLNEAGLLLQEGVDVQRIDRLVEGFGMPMGPFVLADETGIDVGYKVIRELEQAFAPRLEAAPVLQKFIDAGLLGRKAGKGFYLHKGRQREINPEAAKLLEEYSGAEISDEEIVERLILTMLNEAAMCLEEHVIERVDYLDMALICGIGFPPFRGGLLRYADALGIERVERALERMREEYGERFKPAALLQEMARKGRTFYENGFGKGGRHGR